MPRYYFHILDGTSVIDETGVELAGLQAARVEAIELAGAVLREGISDRFWEGDPWQLVVTDSPSPRAGRTHFVLSFSTTSPGIHRARGHL